MLREQDIIRNELLTRYEKRNEDMTKEVSIQFILGTCLTPFFDCLCLAGVLQGAE